MNTSSTVACLVVKRSCDEATLQRCRDSVAWIPETMWLDEADACSEKSQKLVDWLNDHQACWILLLSSDEWLADDAPQFTANMLMAADETTRAFTLPCFHRWDRAILKGTNFYPDPSKRLVRGRFLGVAKTPSSSLFSFEEGQAGSDTVVACEQVHIQHAMGSTIEDAMRFFQRRPFFPVSDAADSFRSAVSRAHDIMARSENSGDAEMALSTLMAWREIGEGLKVWDQAKSGESIREVYTLPISTVTRQEDEGLLVLLAERRVLKQTIEALRQEIAKNIADFEAREAYRKKRFILIRLFDALVGR